MNTPLSRDLISEQRQALIEALKRYGYTFIPWHDDSYCQEIHTAESKPYYVYFGLHSSLIILHRPCTDCWRAIPPHHEAKFLKAMIPVIGRLDAHARYDDHPGRSPRLWIRL